MCLFFNDCIACGKLCFTELFFVSLLTLLQIHRGMLMKTDEVQIGGKPQCSCIVSCSFEVFRNAQKKLTYHFSFHNTNGI